MIFKPPLLFAIVVIAGFVFLVLSCSANKSARFRLLSCMKDMPERKGGDRVSYQEKRSTLDHHSIFSSSWCLKCSSGTIMRGVKGERKERDPDEALQLQVFH